MTSSYEKTGLRYFPETHTGAAGMKSHLQPACTRRLFKAIYLYHLSKRLWWWQGLQAGIFPWNMLLSKAFPSCGG